MSLESTAPSGQALPAGTRLEEFEVERVLGTGGFGITYLAQDVKLGRKVVIKENLPAQFAFRDMSSLTVSPRNTVGEDAGNFAWSLENFSREASTLASLDHPGIVPVMQRFETNGTAYFVMPFMEGLPLDELMKNRRERGEEIRDDELRGLLEHVLDALGYLHRRGIYHRDIKPGNILVTKEGVPILIDFGSARQRLSERSMTVVESAGYTPFEQLQSRGNVGPWSDLYALGATVAKAITGEAPPKATDRAFDDPWIPLAKRGKLRGRYSGELLESIDRALEPQVSPRFQESGEWLRALQGEPGEAQTISPAAVVTPPQLPPVPGDAAEVLVFGEVEGRRSNSKRKGMFIAVGVAVLLTFVGVRVILVGDEREEEDRVRLLQEERVRLAQEEKEGAAEAARMKAEEELAAQKNAEEERKRREAVSVKEPRWKQLSQAYGFVLGQQTSLELVEMKFPTLAKDAKEAWFAFNSTALGGSGLENELARELGNNWPEFKEQMATQMNDSLGKQNLTLQQADEFLVEVRRRAKGEMPGAIRSALLSAHPRYSKNPALELLDGWKQTFRTKGHAKAKGVDFSISLPASWSRHEGNRPNVIQTFRSGSGHGPVVCALMVKAVPLPPGYTPAKEELKEFFQPDELKGMVPDGGKFVTAQELVLDGAPAGMFVCDITAQRLDITISMRMTQFVTFEKNAMISIQFMVSKLPGTENELDQLQGQFLPTFRSIASTYVLNDRYK